MSRKNLIVLFAAAMMTLSASSAFASFADSDLLRVVYERTTGTTEQITDLGQVSTFLGAGAVTTKAGDALIASNPTNLFVEYLAVNKTTGDVYVSNSTTVAPVAVGSPGFTTTKSGLTSLNTYYNTLTADANGVKTGQQSNGSSFKNKLDANQGALANAVNGATRTTTEASLASIVGQTSGSVAQNLYFFNANIAGAVGTEVASITTNFDGSTTITSSAVASTPIPPAFFLMGSGLLGMVGLRRKNKVA